nr:hypothetical protein Ade03nite_79610 [Actinoplanes derwentensis]
MPAGQQGDDPVALAEFLRAQNHRVVAVELAAVSGGHDAILPGTYDKLSGGAYTEPRAAPTADPRRRLMRTSGGAHGELALVPTANPRRGLRRTLTRISGSSPGPVRCCRGKPRNSVRS